MDSSVEPTRQLLRLRGRSYVAFVFAPAVPIVGWLEEVDATLARSPNFFVGKPIVLDLSAVDLSQSAIAHLIKSIEHDGLANKEVRRTRQRCIDFFKPTHDGHSGRKHKSDIGASA